MTRGRTCKFYEIIAIYFVVACSSSLGTGMTPLRFPIKPLPPLPCAAMTNFYEMPVLLISKYFFLIQNIFCFVTHTSIVLLIWGRLFKSWITYRGDKPYPMNKFPIQRIGNRLHKKSVARRRKLGFLLKFLTSTSAVAKHLYTIVLAYTFLYNY